MAIDLSKSVYDSLQKGLKRARELGEAGNAPAAAPQRQRRQRGHEQAPYDPCVVSHDVDPSCSVGSSVDGSTRRPRR